MTSMYTFTQIYVSRDKKGGRKYTTVSTTMHPVIQLTPTNQATSETSTCTDKFCVDLITADIVAVDMSPKNPEKAKHN